MKRPYEVQFVRTHEELSWVVMPDAFEVRKDFRWNWQATLASWLIRKIGVNARDRKIEVKRALIEPAKIVDAIFKQKIAHIDEHREPKRLLIGSDDFSELMQTIHFSDAVTIGCEYYRGDGRGGRQVLGLDVEVIPWMRGALVMPS
jgi:hypothetical protein